MRIIRTTDVQSNLADHDGPDMIEVTISSDFVMKAHQCVAFMKENGVSEMLIRSEFGYKLFTEDDGSVDDVEVVEENDTKYVVFEPEYRIEDGHAKIGDDGDIWAVFPLEDSGEEFFCVIGNIEDLKSKLAEESTQEPSTGNPFAGRLAAYLERPFSCPFCGSEQIEYGDSEFGSEARQEADCLDCNASWSDQYALTGIVIHNTGDDIVTDDQVTAALQQLGSKKQAQIVVFSRRGDIQAVAERPLPVGGEACIVVDYDEAEEKNLSDEDFERETIGCAREEFDKTALYLR